MTPNPTISTPARSDIDRSVSGIAIFCFSTAVLWFVLGGLLQSIASAKLVMPGLLDGFGFFTYGRVQPAASNAWILGWASLSGFGLALWLVARIAGVVVRAKATLICAIVVWNVALFFGVLGILAGAGGGVPGLELPGPMAVVLTFAFLVIALWCLVALRSSISAGIAQAWLVAALLGFPWVYTTGNLLLRWQLAPGSSMGAIHAWFDAGLFGLWLAPLAFAAIFYFLPLAAGRPVFSASLATVTFWTFLVCAAWMGTSRYQGGPIPAWIVSSGVVATFLLLMPAIGISANLHRTIGAGFDRLWMISSSRFLITAAAGFLLWVCISALVTLPVINSIVHFSLLTPGLLQVGLLGFVSMALIGVIYALCETVRPVSAITSRASLVFWMLVTGYGLITVSTFFGGLFQGFALWDPAVTFANTVTYASPFRWVELAGQLCVLSSALGLARDLAEWLMVAESPAADTKSSTTEPAAV